MMSKKALNLATVLIALYLPFISPDLYAEDCNITVVRQSLKKLRRKVRKNSESITKRKRQCAAFPRKKRAKCLKRVSSLKANRSAYRSDIRLAKAILRADCQNRIPQGLELINAFPNLTFSSPVDLQSPDDEANQLFVVEVDGQIKTFANNSEVSSSTTVLDIRDKVLSSGERGLLGLAFHPNYRVNGFFYVNYTRAGDGATTISRFSMNLQTQLADRDSEVILLTVPQPFANHNGGQLAFGADGYLYIALGDGGSGGDPLGNSQNLKSLLGKILRIDVDNLSGDMNYSIPADNPFASNHAGLMEEIFAYGLRNPWRISFDEQTSRLWVGDVGQSAREEIDIVMKGRNYGWNTMEGEICYSPQTNCDQSGLEIPIFDYPRSEGHSITGGYVYRGSAIPELTGLYIYGDFITGKIWALQYLQSFVGNLELFDTELLISSFGRDNSGEVFLVSYGDGKIYKFSSR